MMRYLHHHLSEFGKVVDLRAGPPINLAIKSFSLIMIIRVYVGLLLIIMGLASIKRIMSLSYSFRLAW